MLTPGLAKFERIQNNGIVNPRQFLFINGLLIFLVVVSFIIVKKGSRSPTRLRFKMNKKKSSMEGPKTVQTNEKHEDQAEKNLNVYFNYNGHSWDAYEVLGIPAGSSAEAVKKAFADASKKQSGEAYEFIEAAYHAIIQEIKKI